MRSHPFIVGDNMFDRIERLIGKDNLDRIREKCVLIVGVGGVGGSALETLIRSGIENVIVVDYDVVDITNLNRQVISNNNNIGTKKVDVCLDFCKNINPNCSVKKYDMFLSNENIDKVFDENKIDFVIDACDSIKTKQLLISESIKRNIEFISCMGTGNKLDPTKLQITDIRKTTNDPLAKLMRKWVKDERIKQKVPVVSSLEVPIKKDKVISTMSFVPNTAGILLANYVIKKIIKI